MPRIVAIVTIAKRRLAPAPLIANHPEADNCRA
jgi:hypothetical protein